jgi:hypothetical protein
MKLWIGIHVNVVNHIPTCAMEGGQNQRSKKSHQKFSDVITIQIAPQNMRRRKKKKKIEFFSKPSGE